MSKSNIIHRMLSKLSGKSESEIKAVLSKYFDLVSGLVYSNRHSDKANDNIHDGQVATPKTTKLKPKLIKSNMLSAQQSTLPTDGLSPDMVLDRAQPQFVTTKEGSPAGGKSRKLRTKRYGARGKAGSNTSRTVK